MKRYTEPTIYLEPATDTAVVEADVAYPTDSGLLAKATSRIGASVNKVKAAGGATRM